MLIQEAIREAERTSGKIRNERWLDGIFLWVENGHVRSEHNFNQTGKVADLADISLLLSDQWIVFTGVVCPYCHKWIDHRSLEGD